MFTRIHQVLPACVSAHVERACLAGVLLSAPEYTGHGGGGPNVQFGYKRLSIDIRLGTTALEGALNDINDFYHVSGTVLYSLYMLTD